MTGQFYSWLCYPKVFIMYRSRFPDATFRFKSFLISFSSAETAHKTTFSKILRYIKDAY